MGWLIAGLIILLLLVLGSIAGTLPDDLDTLD
jgi:hypothetical protein